jgi:diaminopropionate ammonia-lyase
MIRRPDGQHILAKDETERMGLGSFKALGGPYAITRLIETWWKEIHDETLRPERFVDRDVREFAARLTFVCATAGNHGLGVAAGAAHVGANARIYLASSVPKQFAERLKRLGADVVRGGDTYEDSLTLAIKASEETGATLLADISSPGYTEIPILVMEGYTVIAEEIRWQLKTSGDWPSHLFLQAGVGGMAAAMAHMVRLNWSKQPKIVVVEAAAAACLKASAAAGRPVRADGPTSNMGRLDCKEPSIVAWQTLELCNVIYETVSDEQAALATRQLAALGVRTTPSGAAGYAAVNKQYPNTRGDSEFLPLVIISECPE